eukprot:COSAG01_NODE_1140_length_11537_cov_73.353995_3_plen_172_part_00
MRAAVATTTLQHQLLLPLQHARASSLIDQPTRPMRCRRGNCRKGTENQYIKCIDRENGPRAALISPSSQCPRHPPHTHHERLPRIMPQITSHRATPPSAPLPGCRLAQTDEKPGAGPYRPHHACVRYNMSTPTTTPTGTASPQAPRPQPISSQSPAANSHRKRAPHGPTRR